MKRRRKLRSVFRWRKPSNRVTVVIRGDARQVQRELERIQGLLHMGLARRPK